MDAQSAPLPGDAQVSTVILSDRFAARRQRLAAARVADDGAGVFLASGTRIDRYLILDRVGGGGMGLVYRAHDSELNRTVALKVLPPPLCRAAEHLNRFRAEAQAQARLHSPYIITLYSMLELPAGAVLVLEYVQGETLETRLRRRGPLATDEAIDVFAQALTGVEHMHDMGVIHRDLKPSNLFLNADGPVKVMDFGVAKLADQDAFQRGSLVGTLLYISPEQINGRAVDHRADIYTMGVSLYEAVTGRLPFERRTDYALMHAHAQESPPPPSSLQRALPAALESAILKAMEKDPSRRFQTAAEFRHALLKHRPATTLRPAHAYGPMPASAAPRRDSRVIAGIALDALLLAMVCALIYGLGLYPDSRTSEAAKAARPAASARTATTAQTAPTRRASSTKQTKAKSSNRSSAQGLDALREAWGQ